jgi:hypothetical protein
LKKNKKYILIHFKTETTFKSNLLKAYHFTVATSTNSDATGQSAHPALPTLLPIEIIIFLCFWKVDQVGEHHSASNSARIAGHLSPGLHGRGGLLG